jgi:formylglycine-generating enzyme required for sulfatase activity
MFRGPILRGLALVATLASTGCRTSPTAEAGATASAAASSALVATEPGPSSSAMPAASAGDAGASAVASAPPEGMVEIPAAMPLIGARRGTGNPEEIPMHEAALAAFFLDRTEVTMDAYRACVDAGRCQAPRTAHPFCNAKFEDRGNHPVNCVDWNDAVAYCGSLGKRLPSEAEWEYAASNGDERRKFSWGNEDPDEHRACYFHPGTCPVGSFAPGAFGLLDMSGNVWEWTSSWFGPYPNEATSGTYKVYRGGSWSRRFPKWLRNQNRNRYRVDEWGASVGIRCAQTRVPLTCPPDADPSGDRCVRARGEPRCEPSYAWNGTECALAGAAKLGGPIPGTEPGATPASASMESGSEPGRAGEPVVKQRTPQYDDDCSAHYPGHPSAYKFVGGGFWDRVPVMKASGCVRRDTGGRWTSGCCLD